MIKPRIEICPAKTLIGMSVTMSLLDNKTALLFRTFMPRRGEIKQTVNQDVYDLQVYDSSYHKSFNPANSFDKWALLEVNQVDVIPGGMRRFDLETGLYAVFNYQGLGTDPSIYQYIFMEWLPKAPYQLDQRPHFDVMGPSYRHDDPQAISDIWIPVREG